MSPPSQRLMLMFYRAMIQGVDRDEVAAEFKIRRATLDRNIRRVERFLARKVIIADAQLVGHIHLQRLENQWQELMAAWQRSCREQLTSKATTFQDGSQRIEITRKQSPGDPRFLDQARRVLAEMRSLLCLDNLSGEEEIWSDVQSRTIDERLALIDQLLEEDRLRPRSETHVRTDRGGETASGGELASEPNGGEQQSG